MRSLTHGTERYGRGALRVTALLTLLVALFAVPSSASAVAPGGFDQLPNPLGCLTDTGSGGVCGTVQDFSRSFDMVVSPDGRNVYAAGLDSNTVVVFDRNPTNGALTQKGGDLGCVRNGAATASCRGVRGNMAGPIGLAMTPNGRTLYVAAFNGTSVLSFDRDPDTGAIAQKPGTEGCIADTASADCRDGRALVGPSFLTVTGDGKHLYAASFGSSSVTALAIDANGVLTQIGDGGGGSGCVENTPTVGNGCADGRALAGPFGLNADSSSGTLYVATFSDASVSALARDPATGRLSALPGLTGCVDREGTDACAVDAELGALRDVAGAPGGQHIYVPVEGQNRVLLYDRQSSGGLVRRAGPGGCVSNGAVAGCTTGRGLAGPSGIIASPDGDDVYVASQGGNSGLVELDRAADGSLTPRDDARGCAASGTPPANCATLRGIGSTYDVKVSPDGRNLYALNAFTGTAVAIFRRDSQGAVCTNASQTVTQGTLTTLRIPCSDVDGDAVDITIVAPPTIGTLGTVDDTSAEVPYAASQGQCGNTSFTYRGTSSGQTSGTATFSLAVVGCSTGGAPPPPPPPGGGGGGAPTLIPSTVSNSWAAFRTFTQVKILRVNNLPAGATVKVTCKTRSKRLQKKRCPYKTRSVTTTFQRARLDLRKPFGKRKLPLRTKVTVQITAAGFIGKVITYTIRRRALPSSTTRCLQPGARTPGRCV